MREKRKKNEVLLIYFIGQKNQSFLEIDSNQNFGVSFSCLRSESRHRQTNSLMRRVMNASIFNKNESQTSITITSNNKNSMFATAQLNSYSII